MIWNVVSIDQIDSLVQDCSNSSALAMELLQSCTKPSRYCYSKWPTKSYELLGHFESIMDPAWMAFVL